MDLCLSGHLFLAQCLHELSYEEEGLDQWILRSMTKAQAENYRAKGGGDNPSRTQTRNQKRNQGTSEERLIDKRITNRWLLFSLWVRRGHLYQWTGESCSALLTSALLQLQSLEQHLVHS